jgi:hypothetical protein
VVRTNFDKEKIEDEKILDKITNILDSTIPEQTTDAMKSYAEVLVLLERTTDDRSRVLIEELQDLYVYPERSSHNLFVTKVYDVRESMSEERIDRALIKSAKGNDSTPGLGSVSFLKKNKLWLVAIALLLLYRRLS